MNIKEWGGKEKALWGKDQGNRWSNPSPFERKILRKASEGLMQCPGPRTGHSLIMLVDARLGVGEGPLVVRGRMLEGGCFCCRSKWGERWWTVLKGRHSEYCLHHLLHAWPWMSHSIYISSVYRRNDVNKSSAFPSPTHEVCSTHLGCDKIFMF